MDTVDEESARLRLLERRQAIVAAAAAGDAATVGRMLDESPELLGRELWPPAVFQAKSLALTSLLLDRGADVNARNSKRNTPLWFACQSGSSAEDRIAVAQVLINAGADVRAGCEEGTAALHFAAWRGPVAMVELLLRRGAKEWQQDEHGKKAIDHARRGNAPDREKIIELLDRPSTPDPLSGAV